MGSHLSQKNKRNSNIELLRIISMILIVLSHYTVFSQIDIHAMPLSFNKLLLETTATGHIGVAVFVMITGYFMVSKRFQIKRIVTLVIQVLFYYISIYILFVILGKATLSPSGIIKAVFPILTGQNWFITTYVILSFLMPFINKVLNGISRKQFILLLIVLCFYNSLAPTFLGFDAYQYGGRISYIVMFYCVGAYINKYPDNILSKKKVSVPAIVLSSILMVASVIVIELLGNKIPAIAGKTGKMYTVYSVLILVLAAALLALITNMRPRYNSLINIIGGCTFGVCVIHINSYVAHWLWEDVCNNSSYINSKWLWLHMLISVCAIYVACTVVEYVRKYILEKYIFRKPVVAINLISQKGYEKLKAGIDLVIKKVVQRENVNEVS